jgi:hypothetical protein
MRLTLLSRRSRKAIGGQGRPLASDRQTAPRQLLRLPVLPTIVGADRTPASLVEVGVVGGLRVNGLLLLDHRKDAAARLARRRLARPFRFAM